MLQPLESELLSAPPRQFRPSAFAEVQRINVVSMYKKDDIPIQIQTRQLLDL